MPAAEQLRLFRARKLSPVEVLQAQIARAEAVEPVINALSHRFFDQAMAEARHAEAIWMNHPDAARALEGITCAVKDEVSVNGQPNTNGSLIWKDEVAYHDDMIITRLRSALCFEYGFSMRSAQSRHSAFLHAARLDAQKLPVSGKRDELVRQCFFSFPRKDRTIKPWDQTSGLWTH